jgi:small subunit ribosomal protein S6
MPLYESVFIARQDISAQQADALADTFSDLISQNGGKVEKRENWGLRGLAYKIKKNRKGHYILFNLDAPAEAVNEMERQMRLHEDILRYMTIRVDELEEGPSAAMRTRHGDDRGGRRRGGDERGRDGEGRGGADRSDGGDEERESKSEAAADSVTADAEKGDDE